jgi:hypothetical protein
VHLHFTCKEAKLYHKKKKTLKIQSKAAAFL